MVILKDNRAGEALAMPQLHTRDGAVSLGGARLKETNSQIPRAQMSKGVEMHKRPF